MRRTLVVLALSLALTGCGEQQSNNRKDIAEHQLEACKTIRDEASRVRCIDGVARP